MGFKGVEIFENDFLVHDLKPKEIKKMVYTFYKDDIEHYGYYFDDTSC